MSGKPAPSEVLNMIKNLLKFIINVGKGAEVDARFSGALLIQNLVRIVLLSELGGIQFVNDQEIE